MNFLFGGGYIIPWVTTTSSNGSYTEFTLKKQGPYTNVINARGDNHILPPSCHFVSWKWGRQTPTLPETNVAPANWWLEDVISYWEGLVSGARNFRRVLWVSHLFRCISKQALQPLSAGGIRRDRSSCKAFPSAAKSWATSADRHHVLSLIGGKSLKEKTPNSCAILRLFVGSAIC